MASYLLEIPDDKVAGVFEAVCATQSYDPESGLTPAEFTRSIIVGYLKSMVIEYQVALAASAKQLAMDAELVQIREEITNEINAALI